MVKKTNAGHDTLLYTRKGLVTSGTPSHAKSACAGDPVVRAGLLAGELRLGRRQRRGLPVCTVALRQNSLTVARQRGLYTRFPVPPVR